MRKALAIILAATLLGFIANPVWSAGTLKVTTPNSGQKWTTGKKYTIKWSKGNAGASVKIQLLKSGKAYKTVKAKTKNDGRHRWKVPASIKTGSAYTIKITSTKNKQVFDSSNKNFTITKKSGVGNITKADYRYLNKHNASRNKGHTLRWPSTKIKVSGANSASWKKAFRRWPKVRFSFVGSGGDINIVYRNLSSVPACGRAWTYSSGGKITSCKIEMHPNKTSGPWLCDAQEQELAHEIGHCIGFFKHTTDGGLMDAYNQSNQITSPVSDMIKQLYSLSPGTNIKPHL